MFWLQHRFQEIPSACERFNLNSKYSSVNLSRNTNTNLPTNYIISAHQFTPNKNTVNFNNIQ